MSEKRREKLFAKIKENPKHVRFGELVNLFEMFGFEIKEPRGGGSHYKVRLNEYRLTISKPHGKHKHVNDVYVKKAISVFEEIKDHEELEGAGKNK